MTNTITLHQPFIFGDTSGNLGGHAKAAAQDIATTPVVDGETVVGDAQALLDHALGGNDSLDAFGFGTVVIGDAVTIANHARGGDDHVTASDPYFVIALGDAITLNDHAHGGNDVVAAFTAAGGSGVAFGDALTMTDHAQGGDDLLRGRYQYGDAQTLSGHAIGGNDTLIAGGNIYTTAQLYGDGEELLDYSKGGNDRLVAGPGSDQMWGDAAVVSPTAQTGADTFVFPGLSGHDMIMDFEPGKDHIEFDGGPLTSFNDVAAHLQDAPDGATITVGNPFLGFATILIVGVDHLSASDFIFA